MKKVKAIAEASQGAVTHLAPMESDTFSKLGALVSHCAVVRYDDGSSRKPGWFTIKCQGASWCVQVKDPDSGCQLQAVGDTLDNALALAVILLETESAPWEIDPWLQKQRPKKAS